MRPPKYKIDKTNINTATLDEVNQVMKFMNDAKLVANEATIAMNAADAAIEKAIDAALNAAMKAVDAVQHGNMHPEGIRQSIKNIRALFEGLSFRQKK